MSTTENEGNTKRFAEDPFADIFEQRMVRVTLRIIIPARIWERDCFVGGREVSSLQYMMQPSNNFSNRHPDLERRRHKKPYASRGLHCSLSILPLSIRYLAFFQLLFSSTKLRSLSPSAHLTICLFQLITILVLSLVSAIISFMADALGINFHYTFAHILLQVLIIMSQNGDSIQRPVRYISHFQSQNMGRRSENA